MTTTQLPEAAHQSAGVEVIDMNLEVLLLPVADVDRAKAFYGRLGWRLDVDRAADDYRVIQFTPPGSGCSVMSGADITTAEPGSSQGMHLVVSDIGAAHDDLQRRGVAVSDVYHCESGFACRYPGRGGRVDGAAPDHQTYASFVSFADPDGNSWVLQEVSSRLPGRVDPATTTFRSVAELADALRRAEIAHGEHVRRTGVPDGDRLTWYASFIAAQLNGTELPA